MFLLFAIFDVDLVRCLIMNMFLFVSDLLVNRFLLGYQCICECVYSNCPCISFDRDEKFCYFSVLSTHLPCSTKNVFFSR